MVVIQNILNNNVRSLDARLISDKYYDYMLFKGGVVGESDFDDCLAARIDLSNSGCVRDDGSLISLTEWQGATNTGVDIPSGITGFGVTAVDNGRLHYIKDLISNEEFIKIYFSGLTIDESEKKLALYPVTGNTLQYKYKRSIDTEDDKQYLALDGGFYQGFFKLEGTDYQVLPTYINCDMMVEFKLRPRPEYPQCGVQLNDVYPENKGIFFYLGTRAENKYAEIYNDIYHPTLESGRTEQLTFYTEEDKQDERYAPILDLISDKKDTPMSGITLDDSKKVNTFETDNKFLFFNQTKDGFTVNTWDHENEPIITIEEEELPEYDKNPFLVFHHGKSGMTIADVEKYQKENKEDYDIEKDIIGNAFALKANEDGSISYRYTIKDCDAVSGFSTVEETTLSGFVKDNEWNVIAVRFAIVDPCKYDKCGKPMNLGNRKMRLMIYINGFLKYLSKELPEILLKPLNDKAEKQWGVPYNISLGGGTQGLAERIFPDYYQPITNHYYLEENYAGSFVGDIQSFKIYTCKKQYSDIKTNYIKELDKKEEEVDTKLIYVGMETSLESMIDEKYKQKIIKDRFRRLTVSSTKEGSRIYVVIPVKSSSFIPDEFTCGGAPVVMHKTTETIKGNQYTVFTSGENYPAGAELSIIAVTV